MGKLFFLVAFCFVVGCTSKPKSNIPISFRDSVLRNYLAFQDSMIKFDKDETTKAITIWNFEFLDAYYKNDTSYLKKASAKLVETNAQSALDEISRNLNIRTLYADEAYQFSYSETFCKYAYEITIYKMKQTIILHSAIYEQIVPNEKFNVTEKSDKKVSLRQWSNFTQMVQYADFWNTTSNVEQTGYDGNYLEVNAIVRSPFDSSILANHFMRRRFVSNTAMYSAYTFLFNMSGTTKKCSK